MVFTEDGPVFMLLHQLLRLSKYQAMKRLEMLNLKPNQAGILFILDLAGRLSQKEIAQKMGITPPSMTVALRKLEKTGYILKEADENDQRITRIRLSEKGEDCVKELRQVLEDMDEQLHQGMSAEERLLLRRLLIEMRRNLMQSQDLKGMDIHSIIGATCKSNQHDF